MDRRTVLALVLVAAVILLTPKFFAPPPPAPLPADTTALTDSAQRTTANPAPTPATVAPSAVVPRDSAVVRVPAETLHVADSNASFSFVNTGGALQRVEL